MNAIQLLSSQPWVERLGRTLVHFLWQGTLIVAVYAVLRSMARSSNPQRRYLLACVALAALALAPPITWFSLQAPAGIPAAHAPVSAAHLPAAATPLAAPLFPAPTVTPPRDILPWVVLAWLAGAMVFSIRLTGGWLAALRLRSRFVRPAPAEWQQALQRLADRLRVTRPVRLLVSAVAQTPAVIGWIRPVVLVPAGALAGLPADQLEALLLHELAHIRRADYLVGIVQSIAEALLFYHPAVWWVSDHIRTERELCCDDIAVAATGDVLTYARALAAVETSRLSPVCAAANGGSLVNRVARLLGRPRPAPRAASGAAALTGALLLASTALVVFAQPAAKPKFEVTSVKVSQEVHSMYVRPQTGGRFIANGTIRLVISNAFQLQNFQIVGTPQWAGTEMYAIEAKAEGNPSRDQMWPMVQSMLEDRFQLKSHWEARELPVYALTAVKSGLKLVPPAKHCEATDLYAPPVSGSGVPCGRIAIRLEPSGAQLRGDAVPMEELTRILGIVLGRKVIDQTGFTGKFDLQMDFTPDGTTAGLPVLSGPTQPGNPNPPPPAEPGAPSVFTVLQQQLGLKLDSTKGPVEVLVVDRLEKPAAN